MAGRNVVRDLSTPRRIASNTSRPSPTGGDVMSAIMSANTDNAPPLALPMTFFVTGLAGLITLLVVLIAHVRPFMEFAYGDGAILAATHLMTLGFVSMVMMGAMYQLVPVVLNTKLWSIRLGAAHYALFMPGVTCLVAGMFGAGTSFLMVGGSLAVTSVGVFLYNMGRTIFGAPRWDIPGWFLVTSLTYLALTVAAGWLLAFNFVQPILPVPLALPVHLTLGGVGWFSLTLMGVSYKLLPMFSLTHVKPRHGWRVYGLVNIAILTVGVGSWWTGIASLIGGGVAVVGFGFYAIDLFRLWRGRLRRRADPPVYLALVGVAAGIATVLAAMAAWLTMRAVVVPFFLFFFGWLGASILGYLQKIIPFLVWLHRYSGEIGKRPVPRMKDLLSETWSWWVGILYAVGLVGAVVGLMTGVQALVAGALIAMAGAAAGLAGSVLYISLCSGVIA
jgi:hypothetical protein